MKFKKGKDERRNLSGRPRNVPNKVSNELRKWVLDVVNDRREQFLNDLDNAEPDRRLQMFEKLLAFCLPRPQSIETELEFEYKFMSRLLEKTPDKFLDTLEQRLIRLNTLSNNLNQIEDEKQ